MFYSKFWRFFQQFSPSKRVIQMTIRNLDPIVSITRQALQQQLLQQLIPIPCRWTMLVVANRPLAASTGPQNGTEWSCLHGWWPSLSSAPGPCTRPLHQAPQEAPAPGPSPGPYTRPLHQVFLLIRCLELLYLHPQDWSWPETRNIIQVNMLTKKTQEYTQYCCHIPPVLQTLASTLLLHSWFNYNS